MPVTPTDSRATRTSSHLCGLMTAVTSFMVLLTILPRVRGARWRPVRRLCRMRTRPGSRGSRVVCRVSECGGVAIAGADPDDRLDRADPDLAVADPARPCRLD